MFDFANKNAFSSIIGHSPALESVIRTAQIAAAADVHILIEGETGTGKELMAQALQQSSKRADQPFVIINCAAMPADLVESLMFGHEKGAFTGADSRKDGYVQKAAGGTLFLDEIGELPLAQQAKLLRFVENGECQRIGSHTFEQVDVRILAATNQNLLQRVNEGKFRQDLFYRLSVVTQQLPSLAERPEDILPLAEYFLKQFCLQARRKPLKISAEAKRRLQAHSWPGNVRELRNLMERIAFLAQGDRVEADDLAFILSPERDDSLEPSAHLGLSEATRRFQQDFIRRSIKRVRGNMSEAARLLGLHRSNLYRKMRQLEMAEGDEE